MSSEHAAFQAAQQRHHHYMVGFGKKQRYIEVFQCSGEDMSLVLTGNTVVGTATSAVNTPTTSGSKTAGLLQPPPSAAAPAAHPGMLPLANAGSSSLTGLDPTQPQPQQPVALAAAATTNPFLLASLQQQQNPQLSQIQNDAFKQLNLPISTVTAATLPVHTTATSQAAYNAASFLQPAMYLPQNNLYRLPGLPQPGAGLLSMPNSPLLQNPAMLAAMANQQKFLLQQQQQQTAALQAAALAAQQRPHLAAQLNAMNSVYGQTAAANAGKRSYDQAFVANAANAANAGAKRVYSSAPTISANPTTYSNTQNNGSN